MRKIGSGRGLVSAYPRQLESLIRLSEAHAKMRFSGTVEIVDVEEAKRLHREALKQSATDPKTGIIDVGILTTGVSASERDRRKELAKELKRMLQVHLYMYGQCWSTGVTSLYLWAVIESGCLTEIGMYGMNWLAVIMTS